MKARNAVLYVVGLSVVVACSRETWYRKPGPDDLVAMVPWFANMYSDIAIRPYKMPLAPVAGTIPIDGIDPEPQWTAAGPIRPGYPNTAPLNDAVWGRRLPNPVESTAESIERGRDRYAIYCAVCHGTEGLGDGPVNPAIANLAPSLATDRVRQYSDGYLYALQRDGRGLMRGYGHRIRGDDRWHVVNYIRVLQGTNP